MSSYPKLSSKAESFFMPSLAHYTALLNRLAEGEAQGWEHGAVEALLKQEGNEALRLGLQGYLDQRAAEEVPLAAVFGGDGQCRRHRRKGCQRKLESVFGEVTVTRLGYEGPKLNRVYPLDAALNLPPDHYSHGLQAMAAARVISGSFDDAVEELKKEGGGEIPKRQMQEIAAGLAQDFGDFYAQPPAARTKPAEGAEETPPILVVSADGKGVVMHTKDLREETRQAAERKEAAQRKGKNRRPHAPSTKEKGDRKRMATVATVYEIDRHRRSAQQVLGREESKAPRPKPVRKRVWAGIRETLGEVVEQAFQEAFQRDPNQKRRWVVLIDGSEDLIRRVESTASRYKVEVTILQDFVHVQEYVWKAAHAFYPGEDAASARERWVLERQQQLLRGKAQDVATGLRRAATYHGLSAKEAEPVHKAADYIEKNQARMGYDQALEQGFPIATGVIEGACRHLVKDRMELTGARWRLDDAEAILRLRALKVSGDLDRYLRFHFEQEQRRNYRITPWAAEMPKAA
jgi:hypothetical protein